MLHELNARRGRKGHVAAPCVCRSKPEVFPCALDTRLPSPSALRAELLLSPMISFPEKQWAASATSHVDRRGLGGGEGGVLRHEDNKIMLVCAVINCSHWSHGLNNFDIFAQHLLWILEFHPVLCCCSNSALPRLQEKSRGVSRLRFIPQFQCPQVLYSILHLWEASGVLGRAGQVWI